MDFARAVLMILGLFFHAGQFYGGGEDWLIHSDESFPILRLVDYFIHSFRMEAFYLIAGFFFALVLEKHRPHFLRDRLLRIAVPLFFCGIFINPFMHYYAYGFDFISNKSYIIEGKWLEHLWFLGNLTLYILISIPLCTFIREKLHLSKGQLFVLMVLIVPFLAAGLNFVSNKIYSEKFLFIAVESILNYLPYYVLGLVCFYNKDEFRELLSANSIAISFVIIAAIVVSIEIADLYSQQFALKVLYAMLRGPMVLFILSALIIAGKKESAIVRSFSDSSYTIYLLHLPLFLLLYKGVFQQTHLGAAIEYTLMIVITYLTSYAFHTLVIKKSKLLNFLFNGKPFSLRRNAKATPKQGTPASIQLQTASKDIG